MSKYAELAKECGAEDSILCAGYLLLDDEVLCAFAAAIRCKTLEEAAEWLEWFEQHYSSGHVPARYIRKMAQEGVTK